MLDPAYVARQVSGTWKMAFNRPDWMPTLDRSVDGVFRSFWAIVPCLAFSYISAIYLTSALTMMAEDIGESGRTVSIPILAELFIITASLTLEWAASLFVLVKAGQRLVGGDRTATIIVGYNWAQLIFRGIMFFILVMMATTQSRPLVGLLGLPLIVLAISVVFGVLRRAMPGIGFPVIAGLMICLMLVAYLIGLLLSPLVGVFQVS